MKCNAQTHTHIWYKETEININSNQIKINAGTKISAKSGGIRIIQQNEITGYTTESQVFMGNDQPKNVLFRI